MSIQGITNNAAAYETKVTDNKTKKDTSAKNAATTSKTSDTNNNKDGVICDISSNIATGTKSSNKPDTATIERMKAEAEARNSQLRSLVEKMLLDQGKAFSADTDIYELLRNGKLEVDSATATKAKQDISEDGYYGVVKTSERLVSFAKALSGNDPEKAEELINAVKKGFEAATKAWGGKLPDICKQTLDVTIEKLTAWKDGIENK